MELVKKIESYGNNEGKIAATIRISNCGELPSNCVSFWSWILVCKIGRQHILMII